MKVYAQQGDTIDSLCWRHLGTSAPVEETLLLNPGIAAIGAELPLGTTVILPDQAAPALTTDTIQLWD